MQSEGVLERHLLVWRDPPLSSFLWKGLAPLIALALVALFALGPFARNSIQGSVEREVREQLQAAGYGWVGLAVSGQSVKLSGVEPASGAGAAAIALARAATCATWLGRHTCAVSVAGAFTPAAALPAPTPAQANESPPLPLTRQGCESSLAGILGGEQISFATGSAKIDARSEALLDQLAREVRSCPGTIRIEGYTDTVGRGKVNQHLSQARAAAVREALIARGIPAQRLTAKGYGARRAIADNTTEEGRARNRRIEFHTTSAN